MKMLDYVACGNYFVAMNSELVNVEIVTVNLFADGTVSYTAKLNGEQISLNNKNKFYKSIEAFKKGVVAETASINEHTIMSCLRCRFVEENQFKGWVFNEEIAEEVTFTVDKITVKRCRNISISGTDQYGRDIPQKFYRNRQEVLDHNVVKLIDEEGNVSEMVGINVKIGLEEDQRAMANELKALIEKMRASGMTIVYDDINATISAINTRNIGNVVTYCMSGEGDWEHELDYEDMTQIVSIDARVDDSYILGVCKKD